MQTKTATNSARNLSQDSKLFSHDENLMNESTLATLWAILTSIALLLFGFSI